MISLTLKHWKDMIPLKHDLDKGGIEDWIKMNYKCEISEIQKRINRQITRDLAGALTYHRINRI